ncbi:MAG: DNA cytosine methyltransferase [bacterium]|nr:DNA cytosine methyltransferase [bacterium]
MKLISLFTGAGGLDTGFEREGFEVVWANEFDKKIWDTFRRNFPKAKLDTRSIIEIPSEEIPDNAVGVIGGPPCQSWSEAGALRGAEDERGKLFFEFIRVLRDKRPLFFLAENVSGMLANRHDKAFQRILSLFSNAGYGVNWKLLNAKNYSVPQDRERVIFVGYRKDLGIVFDFPESTGKPLTLKSAIWDLRRNAKPAKEGNKTNGIKLKVANHEYLNGGFSTIYMSRNRVRGWDEQSYTIQAGGRHAPIHPQANKMIKLRANKHIFDPKSPKPYRRFSVRECARIQTFPDDFIFIYDGVTEGYKMVGNAVPVKFAEALARKIKLDMTPLFKNDRQIFKGKKELDNVANKVA